MEPKGEGERSSARLKRFCFPKVVFKVQVLQVLQVALGADVARIVQRCVKDSKTKRKSKCTVRAVLHRSWK